MFWKKKPQPAEKSLSIVEVKNLMLELGLTPTVIELFEETCTDARIMRYLKGDYEQPYRFFKMSPAELQHYRVERYAPLLATGFQSAIFAYDRVSTGFVTYSMEYFVEEDLLPVIWDGLFVGEIFRWREAEWPAGDILYIAEKLGITQARQILDVISDNDLDYDDFEAFLESPQWEVQQH